MTDITTIITMSDQERRDRIKADAEAADAYDETTRTNTVTRALASIALYEQRRGYWEAVLTSPLTPVGSQRFVADHIGRCNRIIAAERAVLGEME